jgi:hypothetical protein
MPTRTKVEIFKYIKTLFETEAVRRRAAAELFDDNSEILDSVKFREHLARGNPNNISGQTWSAILAFFQNDDQAVKYVTGLDSQLRYFGLVPASAEDFLQGDLNQHKNRGAKKRPQK